jgi:hypothetical protein
MARSKSFLPREVFDPCALHRASWSAGGLLVRIDHGSHDLAVIEDGTSLNGRSTRRWQGRFSQGAISRRLTFLVRLRAESLVGSSNAPVFEHEDLGNGIHIEDFDNLVLTSFLGEACGFEGHGFYISVGARDAVAPDLKHRSG